MNIYTIKIELQKVEIAKLKAKLEQRDINGRQLKCRVASLATRLTDKEDAYRCLEEKHKAVKANFNCTSRVINSDIVDAWVKKCSELEAKVSELRAAIVISNDTFRMTEKHVKDRDAEILAMVGEIYTLKTQIKDQYAEFKATKVDEQKERIDLLEAGRAVLEDNCANLRTINRNSVMDVIDCNTRIRILESDIEARNAAYRKLKKQADKSCANFNTVCAQLKAFKTEPIPFDIIELRQEVAAKQAKINTLQREVKNQKMTAMYSSPIDNNLVLRVEQIEVDLRNLIRND